MCGLGDDAGRFRLGDKKEAAGVCGGRVPYIYIWNFNRLLFGISSPKSQLGELEELRHCNFSIQLTRLASHNRLSPRRGSVRRASGFVLVVHSEVIYQLIFDQ